VYAPWAAPPSKPTTSIVTAMATYPEKLSMNGQKANRPAWPVALSAHIRLGP
jgi:hypothetical protein